MGTSERPDSSQHALLCILVCVPVAGCAALAGIAAAGSPLRTAGVAGVVAGIGFFAAVLVRCSRSASGSSVPDDPGARWASDAPDWMRAVQRHDALRALHSEHELGPRSVFLRLGPDDPATKRLHEALIAADRLRTATVPDPSRREAYVRAVAELDSAWTAAGGERSSLEPAALTVGKEVLPRHRTKHAHDWQRAGYGGADWYVVCCTLCGATETE